jgi:hypothetical protein
MNKNILSVIIFVVALSYICQAQDIKENWVAISITESEALYISVTGISIYTGDDIYVWALQETKDPLTMDEIDSDIYKTKTYYLINKVLMRYSIVQVMFFDKNDNILKSYSYDHNMDNPEFKYSTPIVHGSDVERILAKCLEYIPTTTKPEN